MKIAVVGKGGVGKTTVAASIARLMGRKGYNVIAVDADPSLNLAIALGIPRKEAENAPVLFDEEEFIKSRTMLSSGVYRLNPKVEDVVEVFGVKAPDNVTLLKFGAIKRGGTRCLCPEYAFLRALLSHLILGRKDVVVLDMVAGLEHMSRGVARGVDYMLCIVEPSIKSIDVALQLYRLAEDIGVKKFTIVANKVIEPRDLEFIRERIGDIGILATIPYDEAVIKADREGVALVDYEPQCKAVRALARLVDKIVELKEGS